MNEFFLHEQLCALEDIAGAYPAGRDCGLRVRESADRIVSQTYRVAVIGEFKKGKSSLINALLGTELLPTDILPMTAAINRVVYGDRKRITVHYKNGESEERTVEELLDFGTKYDARRERTAQTVAEIVIHYPSVFCKNHIELIDTPGLNDSAFMTEVTMSVLGDVDAAVFVTSAREPMSMTEQEAVLMLLGQPEIRHIVFVTTCMDIFSREEEQARLLETVRTRLRENTLSAAGAKYGEEPAVLEKARRILAEPDLYGVSSVLAMKGFVRDDETLLEESRFPAFKNSLLDFLTAAQSTDMASRTVEASEEVSRDLAGWYQSAADALEEEQARLEQKQQALTVYRDTAQEQLTGLLHAMVAALEERGARLGALAGTIQGLGQRKFIDRLSSLRVETATHVYILEALCTARQEAEEAYGSFCQSAKTWVEEEMTRAEDALAALRQEAGFSPEPFRAALDQWQRSRTFPGFIWAEEPISPAADLAAVDVMFWVRRALVASLEELDRRIERYIASWRVVLIRQVQEDIGGPLPEQVYAGRREELRVRRNVLDLDYQRHRQQAEKILERLRAGA